MGLKCQHPDMIIRERILLSYLFYLQSCIYTIYLNLKKLRSISHVGLAAGVYKNSNVCVCDFCEIVGSHGEIVSHSSIESNVMRLLHDNPSI